MRSFINSIAILCLCILLSGCGINSRVNRQLDGHLAEQKAQYEELLSKYDKVPAESITWDEALRRLNRDNLQLRQSALKLEQARKQRSEVWKSLIPRIGSFVNVGSSISELSNLSSDDLNVNLIASFRIPNPFRLYGQLYAAALQAHVAEWSNELDKRRAYIELYRAFVQAEGLERDRRDLQKRKESLLSLQNDEIAEALQQIRLDEQGMRRRVTFHRLQLNRLLNTPGKNWRPSKGVPSVSFGSKLNRIRIGENFGKLGLNLQAAQIEGACLRLRQVKFQQWPQFNFSLGLPTLYSNQNQDGFSTDEVFLFSGTSKQFDLTDIAGLEDIKDTRRRLELLRERLRLTTENETARISGLIRDYRVLEADQRRLRSQLRMIDEGRSTMAETVLDDLEQKRKLDADLRRAQDRLLQYDLQFLIWDESYWK